MIFRRQAGEDFAFAARGAVAKEDVAKPVNFETERSLPARHHLFVWLYLLCGPLIARAQVFGERIARSGPPVCHLT